MIFYHGTIDAYVPQILKEGLRPNLLNAWRTRFRDTGNSVRAVEPIRSVYLVQEQWIAAL